MTTYMYIGNGHHPYEIQASTRTRHSGVFLLFSLRNGQFFNSIWNKWPNINQNLSRFGFRKPLKTTLLDTYEQ